LIQIKMLQCRINMMTTRIDPFYRLIAEARVRAPKRRLVTTEGVVAVGLVSDVAR